VRVVRIEQLYPFPHYEFKHAIEGIDFKTASWVQEEPANMGAWFFVKGYMRRKMQLDIEYIGRPAGASTAAGSSIRHAFEQNKIVEELLSVFDGGQYQSTHASW
jgi:2-oxoglutarate dehydrogenase E1 component